MAGFYYDIQKKNQLTSVTLHANYRPPAESDPDGDWLAWGSNEDSDYDTVTDGGSIHPYGKKPLASAILLEDFTVGITNNFEDFDGGDPLGNLYNSFKPYAAYLNYGAEQVGKIKQQTEEYVRDNGDSFFGNMASKILPYIEKGVGKADYFLNRTLVTQGTRFSYYQGTSIGFGNLNMKFTIFADWIDGTFKTVADQMKFLYPYLIGKYVPIDKDTNAEVNRFFGWQRPPGGFKPNMQNIDTVQKGTLKLVFGGYYSLPNLVARDVQLNFSKQMIKNPTSDFTISPLFCEVMITFQPATKYTDDKLREFVEARNINFGTKEDNPFKKGYETAVKRSSL